MNHDTPEAIAITDKAAMELLVREKLLRACKTMIEWGDAEKSAKPFVDDGGAAFYARVALCESAFAKARAAIKEAEAL